MLVVCSGSEPKGRRNVLGFFSLQVLAMIFGPVLKELSLVGIFKCFGLCEKDNYLV